LQKAFILGLDGGDWYFVNRGISKGVLPNFEKIIEEGTSGVLESLPPLTAPAWSTISTGREIMNHGIAGFSWRDPTYKVRMISAKDKKANDIWEYVDKSIVINVPITYPVKEINGIIIGGMMSPTLNAKSIYPHHEISTLENLGYVIEPEPIPKAIKESLDIRIETVKHYFKRDWRLFFVVFREFDIMQHNFWDKSFPLYKKIDSLIGWLLENMDNKTNLFIVSDHGFAKVDKVFIVENWLREYGYLKLTKEKTDFLDTIIKKFYSPLAALKRSAEAHGLTRLPVIKEVVTRINKSEKQKTNKRPINFEESLIVYGLWGELFINSKDKFKNGFVDPLEIPKIAQKLKEDLLSFKDKNGIQVISYAETKRELKAWHIKKVPDVVFFVNSEQGYTGTPSARFTNKIIIPAKKIKKEGDHTKNAIFIAYGPNIKKGSSLNRGRKLVDFVPTVLKTLNIKAETDGNIMKEVLK